MATRKQKHAAAMAKREGRLEESRISGLAAQKKDRERRARQSEDFRKEAEEINQRHRAILEAHRMENEAV